MACIDKTYFKSYEQYKEVSDWCHQQGTIIDDYGNKFTLTDYLPRKSKFNYETGNFDDLGEYDEAYINEAFESQIKEGREPSLMLWNTGSLFDVYLIRHCPVGFVQERLKEQYCDEYDEILKHEYVYDRYERNGLDNPHFKLEYSYGNVPLRHVPRFLDYWYINVDFPTDGRQGMDYGYYDEVKDYWYPWFEPYNREDGNISSSLYYPWKLTKRKLARMIKKWKLPKGCKVECRSYNRYKITATIKG